MKWFHRIQKNRIYRVIRGMILRYFRDGVSRNAAELAYFLLFSFFPLVIFFSLLIGTFQLDVQEIDAMLRGVVPRDVLEIALHYIEHINTLEMDGLMYSGLVMAVWSATRAMRSLSGAVNLAYRMEGRRHAVVQFLLNVGFSLAILVAFLITVGLMILGPKTLHALAVYLPIETWEIRIFSVLRYLPVSLLVFGIVTCLYSVVPNRRIAMRRAIPGALTAMLTWLAGSIAFSYYVENLGRYSLLYGSIGAVIVLLLWLYLTGVVLIMGAELNHVLYLVLDEKAPDEELMGDAHPFPQSREDHRLLRQWKSRK